MEEGVESMWFDVRAKRVNFASCALTDAAGRKIFQGSSVV